MMQFDLPPDLPPPARHDEDPRWADVHEVLRRLEDRAVQEDDDELYQLTDMLRGLLFDAAMMD